MASDSHNPPDARVRELEAENARLREALDGLLLAARGYARHKDPIALYLLAAAVKSAESAVAREALEAGER